MREVPLFEARNGAFLPAGFILSIKVTLEVVSWQKEKVCQIESPQSGTPLCEGKSVGSEADLAVPAEIPVALVGEVGLDVGLDTGTSAPAPLRRRRGVTAQLLPSLPLGLRGVTAQLLPSLQGEGLGVGSEYLFHGDS